MPDDEQQIKVGQIWTRNSDGVQIRISQYIERYDDTRYRRRDIKRGGAIYGSYLRARYSLTTDATTPTEGATP